MGSTVLDVRLSACNPYLRAYAHCSPDGRGVSLLVLNEHPSKAARFELRDAPAHAARYSLSAPSLASHELRVNDVPLRIGAEGSAAAAGGRPELELHALDAGEGPWLLPAASSAFFELRGLDAAACNAASPTVQLSSPAP